MQNFINYYPPQPDGKLYLPWGSSRVTFIDARDIALAAATVLTSERFANQTFLLTDEESLSVEQVGGIITAQSGRPVQYVPILGEAARNAMQGYGVPDWLVNDMMELHQSYQDGVQDKVAPDFSTITGRKPQSFAAFTDRYKIS